MMIMATHPRPPVTQLRPLHSHQYSSNRHPGDCLLDETRLLHWSSALEPNPNEDTAVGAFVKLVSLLVILDPDDEYCIQDSARGGFVLARIPASDLGGGSVDYSFVGCPEVHDIPTDFSIGKGKAVQLHINTGTGRVCLAAHGDVVPNAALEAIGTMLDDVMLSLQRGTRADIEWTRPSVLNFPPKSRPLPLFLQEPRRAVSHQDSTCDSHGGEQALLHGWFEQRVAENPNRLALDYLVDLRTRKRIQYTYQQVENVANALAAELVRASELSQSLALVRTVAVLIGPCPELYISYLAALKAGMAFSPLPADAPEERIKALLADLQPTALLVAGEPPEYALSPSSPPIATINATPYLATCDAMSEESPSLSPSGSMETDLAYILYTSGTTGMPKGVAVSHLSVACTITALSAHFGFVSPGFSSSSYPSIRWFQGAAPTFDISLFEIFWTLSTGSTLCCAPRELTLQDIDKVVTIMAADMINITPSFATLLDPLSIRGLMVGGETLNTRLLQGFSQYNPPLIGDDKEHLPKGIYNGYGPTEAAIYCIAQAHIPENQRGSVIGTPLETCGALIVGERTQAGAQTRRLEPVPFGAIGELVITGPQVSVTGYHNRADETVRAFTDDSRWGRAYKTGDRARIVWSPQGEPMVEFLGRISDDQVKLSGRRVELGEIESVLASRVDGVRETMACIWANDESTSGSERIVSLVVPEPHADLHFELVRQRCLDAAQRFLPDYMRPFKIIEADSLPKSASGKLNRREASIYMKKLMEQSDQVQDAEVSQEQGHEHVSPLPDPKDAMLETHLVSIMSEILNDGSTGARVAITATTPLAEAGVDSLRAMRLLREIRLGWASTGPVADFKRQQECLQPPLALLLDSRASIRSVFFPAPHANVSARLDAKRADVEKLVADFSIRHIPEALNRLNLAIETDVEMILPTTTTQSQLAVSFAMNRRNYISHSVLSLRSDVSHGALREAIERVVSRQAIYRCAMLPCDDPLSAFSQVVMSPEGWNRFSKDTGRVVLRKSTLSCLAGDASTWLDLAEANINLESQQLYYIQVIEPESDMELDSASSGLLCISVAHCICDGASLEVLQSDIAREHAGLEPLQRRGIHEVVLEWVSSTDRETDKLWQDSLGGWEPESFGALSGNNSRPPPSGAGSGHGVVQYASPLPWQILEDKSRAMGANPLSILQASWSLLLHMFSEADTGEVVFGNVLSGNSLPTHAPVFSVVPCRVALPEAQSVHELTNNLSTHARFAFSHRHMSLGIFETLPYNTALALQSYAHDTGEPVPLPWTEIQQPAIHYDLDMFAEVFPIDCRFPGQDSQSGNMSFKLTYREDVLSKLSATCVVRQLSALTEIILDSSPGDIARGLTARLPRSLLSAEGTIPAPTEGDQGSDQQNGGRSQLLHSQFESQANLTPQLLALSFYTSLDSLPIELSYAELDGKANSLAKVLREEDVEIIPMCLHRSVELYVAILAILKAGSAWCPIDETSPVQRRTSLIARTGSKLLLSTTESLHLVNPCLAHESLKGVRVILLDKYADQATTVRGCPRHGVSSSGDLSGRDLAYLLWTSGTTGEPKGVMVQHGAAVQAMRDLQAQVEHDKEAGQVRTLQLSAYSFDVFVQDLFYTWGLAGKVISGTRELVLGTFVEFIWKSRPTHAHLTPSFGASIDANEIRGSTLQYVTFIGEKLTEDVAEAWAAPGVTTRAYNTYGPAENAVVSTMRQFYGRNRDLAKAANVGFPLNSCTAYVVHEVAIPLSDRKRWELVPRYGVGELALGGAQVAKGYLGNEDKTSKAFIEGVPGVDERIYLTGDVVRLNDHGFEFLGRNDDLVKITGIRIELSEISSACASVRDQEAAIEHVETLHLPRPGTGSRSNNQKVIVTFVSAKKSFTVDTAKIRSRVFQKAKEMLPAYMVPGHVVVLDSTMPRTASNKVDRKALQEIYSGSDLNVLAQRDGPDQSVGHDEQSKLRWTEEQLLVLQAISDEFGIEADSFSPRDTLAGLGFGSLQITKLAWSLRRKLGCIVGVIDLMRCQSLGDLVVVVLSKLPEQEAALSPAGTTLPSEKEKSEMSWVASVRDMLTQKLFGKMRPQNTSYILPATPFQESLIVETMREPQAYWAHRVFDLAHLGRIDGRRLKSAWASAARKFDILRTIFVPLAQLDLEGTEVIDNSTTWARKQKIDSTILQLVHSGPAIRWLWLSGDKAHDLSKWAEKLQLELAPATTLQPPWAVTFAEGSSKVMLSIHHALYDSVSSEILLDTVAGHYLGESPREEVIQLVRAMELGLLPTASQRKEAASIWETRLAMVREVSGPLNAPFPDLTQSRHKNTPKIHLARRSTPSSLIEVGAPSLPTLMQSAFGCVLASYLELNAIVLGQAVSQRILHPSLARLMGPAITTLPVIIRADAPSAEDLWSDMARDSSSIDQTAHRLHPVDIKRMINSGSDGSSMPFPGLFVYHPATESNGDSGKKAGPQVFSGESQALSLNVEHPLALNIFETEGAMELSGSGGHISQAQLELMMNQVIDQARMMLEYPKVPLNALQNRMARRLMSVSGEEITDQTGTVDPTEKVALLASEHPDWIAVEEVALQESGEGEDKVVTKTFTYAQLNALTNAIANKLASHAVGLRSDDVVALYMSRDTMSLAATLAIFRAGFVYLPVDEDLPPARRQLLVRDARAKLLITTEDMFSELNLNLENDPPSLLLPDGNDGIETMASWVSTRREPGVGNGGYLLYTSGSTGRPKGVRVSNSNLCHFLSSFIDRLTESSPATATLGGAGKYLNLTSRAFDPHITQLFVPWHLGYRVVIGKDRTAMLGSLELVINELGITHFGSVPSLLMQLGLQPKAVPSVRVVTTGGEKASKELLDTWSSACEIPGQAGLHQQQQHVVLFNFYGPTETTIGCLGHAVNHESNARNLGLPLRGLQAILLRPGQGDEQVIARRGQPGELYVLGPQVAMGYLDRPIENAKSFQHTSLLGCRDTRMYRTGDIMRMMHDGTLEFLGRADQQAKIRGQRLEIGEVESFLREATTGEGDLDFAAAVVGSGDAKSGQQQKQLLGFMARKAKSLLKEEADGETELLRNQSKALARLLERVEQKCHAGLPAFMVPTLLWVSKIPYLAASGKVDTKLLSDLASEFFACQGCEPSRSQIDLPPTPSSLQSSLDARESVVVAAVEEALGGKVRASATNTLHSLGIDSLSAVHLVSLLRKQGFSRLGMGDILSPSCTVGSIGRSGDQDMDQCVHLSDSRASTSPEYQSTDEFSEAKFSTADLGPLPVGLESSHVEAVLPCLPLQSALIARSLVWLSANGVGDGARDAPYVAQFHYRLSRGTDVVRWKSAVELAVGAEAMLRTCFIQREDDGRVFQVVLRSPAISPFEGPEEPTDIVAQMSFRAPIRFQVQEDVDETVVSLKIHHALFDGVAIEALRNRIKQGYDEQWPCDNSIHESLKTLRIVSGYCYLSDIQVEETKRLWQARLRDIQPCHIGTGNGSNRQDIMARSTRCLAYTAPQLRSKLQAQSEKSGVMISTSSAFQMATSICLAQLTRRPTVIYGFVMSLRPLLRHVIGGVDEFVGPCINTLIHSLSLKDGNETLLELAQRVHRVHADACHGTLPLVSVEQVQRWAGSEDKLFDSLLSINLVPTGGTASREADPGTMSTLDTQSKSDMALAIDIDVHTDGIIKLTCSSAGALTETQLNGVGQLFERVVSGCADENMRVDHFVQEIRPATGYAIDSNHATETTIEPPQDSLEDFREALSCVEAIASRLLRQNLSGKLDRTKPTSLYQLGIDSITVLPFVKLIKKSEGIRITADAAIKARTIQGVARLIQEAKSRAGTLANDTTRQDPESKYEKTVNGIKDNFNDEGTYDNTLQRLAKDLMFVATPLQEGMLSASLATAGEAYTYTHTIQLSSDALRSDTPGLAKFFSAVEDTVRACEVLRTRFIFTQDDDAPWVGVVSPAEQTDLIGWNTGTSDDHPGIIRLRIHHSLYDATSIRSVWRILGENYRRRLRGHDQGSNSDDATGLYLFRPFARVVASAQRTAVEFWANLVHDYRYSPLSFLNDNLNASSTFHFTLAKQDLLLLQDRCRGVSVTIRAALQLAWARVLCETLYGQADVVYGEVVSTGSCVDGSGGPIIGPTINTVPMRVKLSECGKPMSMAEALARVQGLSDDTRGSVGMASLRKIQTMWRTSSQGQEHLPASLFQSLFVFDAIVAPEDPECDISAQPLFEPVQTQTQSAEGELEDVPAYDDYPLIASFLVKNDTLQGKLRAKMNTKDLEILGSHLESALRCLVSDETSNLALDTSRMDATRSKTLALKEKTANVTANGYGHNNLEKTASSVLDLAKKVLGTRCEGKHVGYSTRLVNVGLDSILAIRLSRLLKKQMGINSSIFEIIRGASVYDIVKNSMTITQETAPSTPGQGTSPRDEKLKGVVAGILGLSEDVIKSVLPVLPGQRAHLEQWLYNGKRFFEAPWVYQVDDDSLDAQNVAHHWTELCRIHEVLRTTFVWLDTTSELVQVTLGENWTGQSRFIALQDLSGPVESLIEETVGRDSGRTSNLMEPPTNLTFLEGSDGKAIVLRIHHSLYDAGSIKLIESDFDEVLASRVPASRTSLEHVVSQMRTIRDTDAEISYWRCHLSNSQDTVLGSGSEGDASESSHESPLGQHFKASYSAIVSQRTLNALGRAMGGAGTSAAIVLAYARTLAHFTKRTHPTFGLSHASRSLSSADGRQTLDLSATSVPTLTITPCCINLDDQSPGSTPLEVRRLALVQDHLAELTRYAQADGLQEFCPRFNSYLNILRPEDNAAGLQDEDGDVKTPMRVLRRYKLKEDLASHYFTVTEPSTSTISTIDGLGTSHLCPHRLFFNVIVRQDSMHVVVSGDNLLCGGGRDIAAKLVSHFKSELAAIKDACAEKAHAA